MHISKNFSQPVILPLARREHHKAEHSFRDCYRSSRGDRAALGLMTTIGATMLAAPIVHGVLSSQLPLPAALLNIATSAALCAAGGAAFGCVAAPGYALMNDQSKIEFKSTVTGFALVGGYLGAMAGSFH